MQRMASISKHWQIPSRRKKGRMDAERRKKGADLIAAILIAPEQDFKEMLVPPLQKTSNPKRLPTESEWRGPQCHPSVGQKYGGRTCPSHRTSATPSRITGRYAGQD